MLREVLYLALEGGREGGRGGGGGSGGIVCGGDDLFLPTTLEECWREGGRKEEEKLREI